jgi:hypothetical protein
MFCRAGIYVVRLWCGRPGHTFPMTLKSWGRDAHTTRLPDQGTRKGGKDPAPTRHHHDDLHLPRTGSPLSQKGAILRFSDSHDAPRSGMDLAIAFGDLSRSIEPRTVRH